MNKFEVSLKLIQLLNERKSINSRTVADELGVSLRTAQRYLLELSALPCVASESSNHQYNISPNYKLRDVLINDCTAKKLDNLKEIIEGYISMNNSICVICGTSRKLVAQIGSDNVSKRREELKSLMSIVDKMLSEKKCCL